MGDIAVSDAVEGRRASRRGDEARTALVAAAEHLFAEHGIAGVSLRDVSAAAGQRNHSAAQYHFGDRQGLVSAVYVSHMARVDVRRAELLAAWLVADRPDDVHGLVHAVVVPVVEEVTGSAGWYARFLVRTRWDPVALDVVAGLDATAALVAIGHAMSAALGHLRPPIRRSRLAQLIDHVVSALAAWEWAHDRDQPRLTAAELIDDLTETGAAILLAPGR